MLQAGDNYFQLFAAATFLFCIVFQSEKVCPYAVPINVVAEATTFERSDIGISRDESEILYVPLFQFQGKMTLKLHG